MSAIIFYNYDNNENMLRFYMKAGIGMTAYAQSPYRAKYGAPILMAELYRPNLHINKPMDAESQKTNIRIPILRSPLSAEEKKQNADVKREALTIIKNDFKFEIIKYKGFCVEVENNYNVSMIDKSVEVTGKGGHQRDSVGIVEAIKGGHQRWVSVEKGKSVRPRQIYWEYNNMYNLASKGGDSDFLIRWTSFMRFILPVERSIKSIRVIENSRYRIELHNGITADQRVYLRKPKDCDCLMVDFPFKYPLDMMKWPDKDTNYAPTGPTFVLTHRPIYLPKEDLSYWYGVTSNPKEPKDYTRKAN